MKGYSKEAIQTNLSNADWNLLITSDNVTLGFKNQLRNGIKQFMIIKHKNKKHLIFLKSFGTKHEIFFKCKKKLF